MTAVTPRLGLTSRGVEAFLAAMKAWLPLIGAVAFLAVCQVGAADVAPKLTALERSQGWRYLFDGQSLDDWRGYRQNKIPPNWQVVGNALTTGGGLALASVEEFKDFELQFDWKVSAGGSASVYYRADEDVKLPENSGPVMELAGGGAMAGNGGLSEPWRTITLQPDVWYRAKIMVFGNQVEHWINGDRVLVYLLDSVDWRKARAGSPYKDLNDYGLLRQGRLVLDGKGAVFRNIKVRTL